MDALKPHLTTKPEGGWTILWHRKSHISIWSTPKDFADACRYLKLSDGPRLARCANEGERHDLERDEG